MPTVDSYIVQRSLNGADNWVSVGTVSGATTTFSDTGLDLSTTYYYRVIAQNDEGVSPPSNVANATTGSGGFAPTDIPDILFWLDAANRGVTADQWNDLSGNGNHWVKDTDAGRTFPTFSSGAATFNGTSDSIQAPANMVTDAGGSQSNGDIFIVMKRNAAGSSSGFDTGFMRFSATQTQHYTFGGIIYDSFGRNTRYTVGNPAAPDSDLKLINISAKNTPNTGYDFRIDGSVFYTSPAATGSWLSVAKIGNSTSVGSGYFFYGDIREVVMFTRILSAGERTQMQDYLNAKHGL